MTTRTRTERGGGPASDAVRGTYGIEEPARALALLSGLVLTGAYVSTLADVTAVVGGTTTLFAVVAVTLAVATGTARYLRPRQAAAVGTGLLVAGYVGYMNAVPAGWLLLANLGIALSDTIALLTGLSVLRMSTAGVWAIGFAPGPVFLSWYLFVRQRYAAGAAVGGLALSVFVLTDDAGTAVALAGTVAAAAAIGFGEIERRVGTIEQLDTLAVLVAAMILVGGSITVVPTGSSQPLVPDREPPTVEAGVVATDDRVDILGSISLSPDVRFVVESDEPAYWRVGAYDRYTGQGWVRSGQPEPYRTRLPSPPGDSDRVVQRYTALSDVGVMPAAWRPVALDGAPDTRVTSLGGIMPAGIVDEGTSYNVVSYRPRATRERLRRAGTDYPDDVEAKYTQLPSGTPDRVGQFTNEVVAGADTPYDKAVRIERWLEENKRYSLEVERPEDTIADSFLFEMDAGYCTYFATTMVTMLRTEGIPARFVTGYSTGQRVDENEWVVRGLDSHAWVEVYFPETGWVKFDPTPGAPRSDARQDRVEEARRDGDENVDAAGSSEGNWTPPGERTDDRGERNGTPAQAGNISPGESPSMAGPTPSRVTPYDVTGQEGDSGGLPSRNALGFGLVLLLGAAAAVRRTGVGADAHQLVRIHWQGGRQAPANDVERAFERLETLLSRRRRPRRPGETRRSYLESLSVRGLDERARRVDELYHRARYGDGVSREEADEAIELVDLMARERTPLLWRLQ